MVKPLTCNSFEKEGCNALMSALSTAAENMGFDGEYKEYKLIESSREFQQMPEAMDQPKAYLVTEVVKALKEHGYFIARGKS